MARPAQLIDAKPWDRTVPAASLVALRIGFGALMCVAMGRYFANGWIEAQFVEPSYFFSYPGFEWLAPGPAWAMELLFGALLVLALGIAFGVKLRWTAGLFCLGFTYVHLCDKSNYLNHYYLFSLVSFLFALAPLGRGTKFVRVGWLAAFRLQVGVVYFFAGVAKLDGDWLLRAEPMGAWLETMGELPVLGPLLALPAMPWVLSWTGLVFDLAIVPLLLWRKTRVPAFGLVLVFHLLTAAMFSIGMFPWVMIVMAMVFLPTNWPARVLRRPSLLEVQPARPMPAPVAWLVGTLALVQVAVPIARHLDPRGSHWNERSFRFAWKVMLIEKRGQVQYAVESLDGEHKLQVDPRGELTEFQVAMMSTQPDMILQYGQHLGQRFERELGSAVSVRARSLVSLNRGTARALIRPEADLVSVDGRTPMTAWVTP